MSLIEHIKNTVALRYPTKQGTHQLKKSRNVGIRIQGGRWGIFNNTTAQTFQLTATAAQHFDAVRIIFGETSSTISDYVAKAKVSVMANTSDLNNNSGTWVDVTTNGQTAWPLALAQVATANRVTYTVSDEIKISSVARDDGGAFPLIVIRAFYAANSNFPVIGNGSNDAYANWATKSDGRIWAMRYVAGDQVATTNTWNGTSGDTTNRDQCPIVGFIYLARGKVISVMGVGDSIVDGFGATYKGENYIMKATSALSSQTGVAVEYANCGWSGQSSAGKYGFMERACDILESEIRPDILMFECGSLNDTTGGNAVTTAIRNQWRADSQRVMRKCDEVGTIGVGLTVMPCAYSVHPLGATPNNTDNLRIAHNTDLLAWAATGVEIVDVATVVNGSVEANGQMEMNGSYTADLVHPNDAGNTAVAAVIQPVIQRLAGL